MKRLVIYALGLSVLNILLFLNYIRTASILGGLLSASIIFCVGFPIIAAMLSLLVAFIPYKQLSYRNKYPRSFLLTLITMQIMFALYSIIFILLLIFSFRNFK